MLTEFKSECTEKLSKLRPSSTFLTIHNYLNNFGEISNYSLCFHINYLNSVKRALECLKTFTPSRSHCYGLEFSKGHLESAKMELIASYKMTLAGYNPLATSAHLYDEIVGPEGVIPGIKLHRDEDILHLWGFNVHKKILMPGIYPEDNRIPLTKAKDYLRSLTPLGNFVQFKLTPGRFHRFVVSGITIKESDVIRKTFNKVANV